MAKPAPKTKFLRVPDRPSKREFLSAARQVWKEHHPEDCGKLGRPNEALFVFEACEKIFLETTRRKQVEKLQAHKDHFRDDPQKQYEAFLSYCSECRKDKKSYPFSVYAIRKAIEKEIERKNIKHPLRGGDNSLSPETLDKHIKAWLRLNVHPTWLEKGIPDKYRHHFTQGQIEAYEQRKKAFQNKCNETTALGPEVSESFDMLFNVYQLPQTIAEAIQEFYRDPLDKENDQFSCPD